MNRPWGSFDILYESPVCKVKRIQISPLQAPSYQYHEHRSEVWVIVSGEARVTLNDIQQSVRPGSVVRVMVGVRHRIENVSDTDTLEFIEVQTGSYFGEDDIVRVKDCYGRI